MTTGRVLVLIQVGSASPRRAKHTPFLKQNRLNSENRKPTGAGFALNRWRNLRTNRRRYFFDFETLIITTSHSFNYTFVVAFWHRRSPRPHSILDPNR